MGVSSCGPSDEVLFCVELEDVLFCVALLFDIFPKSFLICCRIKYACSGLNLFNLSGSFIIFPTFTPLIVVIVYIITLLKIFCISAPGETE